MDIKVYVDIDDDICFICRFLCDMKECGWIMDFVIE